MKSRTTGRSISEVEVGNISSHGVWLLLQGKEYFLPYEEFPWFKDATIGAILDVRLERGWHVRWPQLDIDLHVESLQNLENYPLVYK